ncbi:hypothetical protein A2V68_02255 [candidate division Kazan bacterium RBG_13_50_9]|uniref:BIG2 domain-containing protein n=1 Tax=candidate division Kazan bacterium RBG_13_50_9 TaxID=1798535 RepID=A0A1F4NTB9_UNCK3|nr:MAG: hypothetical protein A2V68_02255 [candidate division Kazan bacterium RBG_13_50_9]
MNWFKTFGLRTYYQVRRIGKALRNWRKFGVIIFGSLFIATAIGAPMGVGADQILTAVTIKPASAIVKEGTTKQFSAKAYDQYGEVISSGVSYSWSVTTAAAGTISSGTGLLTAGTAGQYTNAIKLEASFGLAKKFAYASVTVSAGSGGGTTAPILTAITVSPSAAILNAGATKQFSAKAYDQFGQIISNASYAWTASSAAGTINGSGLFTASDTAGKYTNAIKVAANLGGVTKYAYATVTVSGSAQPSVVLTAVTISPSAAILSAGATKQFSTKAYDQFGQAISNASYAWTASSAAGSINDTGLFTAGSVAGYYTNAIKVAASLGGVTKYAYASITVSGTTPPATVLTAVTVSPSATILSTGVTKQFSAKAYDQYGNTINSGVSYGWSASSAAGTISGLGLFTAGDTPGKYTNAVRVAASFGGNTKYAYATVTVSGVTPPPATVLTAVTISPSAVILGEGGTKQFSATAYDQYGKTITSNVTYAWTANSAAGTINQSGYFTASDTPGKYTSAVRVAASLSGVTKYAYATVTISQTTPPQPEIVLMSVSLNPWAAVLNQGANQQFIATAYDQYGQVLTSGVTYSWAVVASGGTITQNGLFAAGTIAGTFPNTVRVKASRNGVDRYAYATVIVNPITTQAVLEWVEIIPASAQINTNSNYQFIAQAYDSNDTPLFSNVSYTWSVISGPGSVSQSGLFASSSSTGTATVQVRATQGGINVYDTAVVTISSGGGGCTDILNYVTITPQVMYLDRGTSGYFSAAAYDTAGCSMYATYTWEVMSSTAGSINQSGYFTAGYTDGTYNNAVRVRAYRNGVERYDYADVVVRQGGGGGTSYYIDATLEARDENGSTLLPGEVVLYTLRMTNNRSSSVSNVRVRMDVPAHTSFISASSYYHTSSVPKISNNQVTWDAGSLNPGQVQILYVRVRVNDNVASGTRIKGSAFITGSELTGGFWVYANDLLVGGTGAGPYEPLTPTGVWAWILAAITALLLTILTRQLAYTRRLLVASIRE